MAASTAYFQQPPPETDPEFVIRTETQLVLVPFHVVHKKKYVADLRAEEIQVLEDGMPQKVAILEGPQDWKNGGRTIPIEVTLLLDVSLSVMNQSLLDSFSIKETLLDGLGDGVSVSIYGFARRLKRFVGPTSDVEKLGGALKKAYGFAHGGTRLYEAIMKSSQDAANSGANATRLMIILSDGFPTSDADPEKAGMVANYYGITLYPVVLGHDRIVKQAAAQQGGLRGWNPARGKDRVWGGRSLPGVGAPRVRQQGQKDRTSRAHAQESRMAKFAGLGAATGGRSFDPKTVNNMMIREIMRSIVKQVKAEYVAGYYPASTGGEQTVRQVQVTLLSKKRGKLYGGKRLVAH